MRGTILILLALSLTLFLSSCGSKTNSKSIPTPTPLPELDRGNLVAIRVIPSSWNEMTKSQVETTKGVWTVIGFPSGVKGEHVTTRGDGFLFIESNKYGYSICGSGF